MKYLLLIIWFLFFTKLFVFWVWLWQLKEYHWGRFRAHFETQTLRKLFFSIHGIRYPKLTKKTILVLICGFILELLFINTDPSLIYLITTLIIAPLFTSLLILLFQIPVFIIIKRTLKRAKEKRKQFKGLTVVGIAGSYGKTAVKEFLFEILSEKFKTLKTKKNTNVEIGIAKTILEELDSSHQFLIVEIGAYERGKIKQVCDIIKPKIGILTGINEQHLSTFGSFENIKKAKYEILECSEIKINYKDLNLIATDIIIEKEYLSFKIDGVNFRTNLLGKHNIDNILLAVSCAKKLGMNLEEISMACSKIRPEQGAMKIINRNPIILDASYSANSDGVIADLEYLKLYSGQKIIIMPCLIELGTTAKEVHQRIGRKIAEVCDLAIITTRDYFKEIKQESPKAVLIESPKEIIAKIKQFAGPGDVVLLEGRVPKEIKSVKS